MQLVFVHGAGESGLSFHYQLQFFPDAIAVDLPGHPKGRPCTEIDGYVEWLRGFNAGSGYRDVVLCGHSMGGAITLLYALRYPEELKGIVLIGSGARLRVHPDFFSLCEQPGDNNSRWLDQRRISYQRVDPEVQQSLMRRADEVGPMVELNDLKACDRFDVMGQVDQIQLPTLAICGSDDIMTPVRYSDYLVEKIEGARRAVIEGGTHFVQLEQPQAVNRQIEMFLGALR